MVPEENGLLVNKLSLYGTLQEILQQLCNLADEKKRIIFQLYQDPTKLFDSIKKNR